MSNPNDRTGDEKLKVMESALWKNPTRVRPSPFGNDVVRYLLVIRGRPAEAA